MKSVFLLIAIVLLGFGIQTKAQSNLLITPKRVVFEGNKQMEELSLVNIGKDTASFSISFLQYNMQEDGSIVIIEKPDSGQMFSDPFLRIFPRQVTLAPGEPQVIMMQCRRKSDMPAGEYRSHLYFRSDNMQKPLGTKSSAADSTLFSVQLTAVYGMSIPVIIRSGSVNVSIALNDLEIENQNDMIQQLKLTISRNGNMSVYGDILVKYVPSDGKPYEVGSMKGVGVYTNIEKRKVVLKLNNPQGMKLQNGKLQVQYVSNGEGKKIIYAESELVIQ